MCGIAGVISKTSMQNIKERVSRMTASIKHRGPDASGICVFNSMVALGHQRLSIIDTSKNANQPLGSQSGQWHIVFNGEIYNFKEIKKNLNYNFKTNSDTEVILAAVQENGVRWFADNANGMFAIALYNSTTMELFLIRDRLGIKPLFYYMNQDVLIFGSEIKAILNSGLVDAKFNYNAIDEYLANRYVRAPYSFFNNIFQVMPGSILNFTKGQKRKETYYWNLPNEFNFDSNYDENEKLEEFETELKKAITYRLIADVPLGTYLSGGIDSSLITGITAMAKKERVNTYTIGFSELNEFEFARLVSNKYDTSHHELIMSKEDYINNWESLIMYKDAPLGVPNEIPLAVMSGKLKEKITVVLSGEGADELLGGYGRIFRCPFEYHYKSEKRNFYDFFISKYEYVSREMRDAFLSTSFNYRKEFDKKIRNEFKNKSNEENVFRFFHKYHVKGLLQRVDMTTMQASVEARVPFLDHNLIEFTYKSIPYSLKLKWKSEDSEQLAKNRSASEFSEILDTPKYLLRKLAYKYLPREIVERKKVGFPVPLTDWFGDMEHLARKLLADVEWLNQGAIENLINKSKNEPRAGQILWMFINIEMFKRNYFNKNWKW